jgi:hypothetical protein
VDELLLLQLNVQQVGGGGIRRTEIQTAESFVPELSISEVDVAVGKLQMYKSAGADQIPAELVRAGGGGNITFWDPQTYLVDLEQRRIVSPVE